MNKIKSSASLSLYSNEGSRTTGDGGTGLLEKYRESFSEEITIK